MNLSSKRLWKNTERYWSHLDPRASHKWRSRRRSPWLFGSFAAIAALYAMHRRGMLTQLIQSLANAKSPDSGAATAQPKSGMATRDERAEPMLSQRGANVDDQSMDESKSVTLH